MSFLKDFIDRGAQQNRFHDVEVKSYLTILLGGIALVGTTTDAITGFLTSYLTFISGVAKFFPLVFMLVVLLLLAQTIVAKSLREGVVTYKYRQGVRHLTKGFLIISIFVFFHGIYSVMDKIKTIDQPIALVVQDASGLLLKERSVRVLNESKIDITLGAPETGTEDGLVLLKASEEVNAYSMIRTGVDSLIYTFLISELLPLDTTIYGLKAYKVTLP